jgi:glycine cleavage system H protein
MENSALNIPNDRHYSREHTWARREGDRIIIGISDFAQKQLGEILFVELSPVGEGFRQREEFGLVESAKSTSDLIMPVGGKVRAVNHALEEDPAAVNRSPCDQGWMIAVEPADDVDWQGLLSGAEYEEYLERA